MKINKKTPMLLAHAAELLAEEHPQFAFSAKQLQRLCAKRVIPHLCMPTCGTQRRYRYMVSYPELVKTLNEYWQSSIH